MDEKGDKKKESIDDILSDLNGLLNRMPSILDGIKMPPHKPMEFENPANGQKAETLACSALGGPSAAETRVIAKPGVGGQALETVSPAQEQNSQAQGGTVGESPKPAAQGPVACNPPEEGKPQQRCPLSCWERASQRPQPWTAPGRMTPPPASEPERPAKVGQAGGGVTTPEATGTPESEAYDRPVSQSLGDCMFSGGHEKQKPALKPRSENLDSPKKHTCLPAPVTLNVEPEQKTAKDEISGSAPLTAAPLFGDAGARDIKEKLSALPGTSGDAEAGYQAVLHTETGFAELSSEALLPPAENEKALPVSQSGDSLRSGPPTQGAGREAGPDHTKPRSYESTADLGIPDIDVLFKISQGEMPETLACSALGGPSAAEPVVPDAFLAANAEKVSAALPPDARHTALAGNLSANAVVADAGAAPLNPVSSGAENLEQELEKLTISDEIQSSVADSARGPRQASVTGQQNGQTAAGGGETVADTEVAPMTLNESNPAGNGKEKQDLQSKTSKLDPAAPDAEGGLAPEQPGAVFPKENSAEGDKTLVAAPASENAEQTPAGVGEPAAVPVSETAGPPAGGLVLEQTGAVFSKKNSAEGDKTLVMAPSADGAGGEHTVIYQSGPDTASRRLKGADLGALSQKQPPEGVTEERVRSLAFLYPEGEEWFCAEVLSELDAICLKSPSKPMFVRRAFVKVFELNTNPNFMFQAVSDAKAAGLIFAGTLPQDKVYELESVFSSSGSLFRHLTADSLNHSSALDLVSELILR